MAYSLGANFTPHVFTVNAGEVILIMNFLMLNLVSLSKLNIFCGFHSSL